MQKARKNAEKANGDQPTNRPTDQPTDMTSYRSARTHLKMIEKNLGNMRTEEGDKRKRAAQLNTRVCNGNLFSLLPIKNISVCYKRINASML